MPDYTQRNARTLPSTMHVFRGEKYRSLLRGVRYKGPQRKRSNLPNGKWRPFLDPERFSRSMPTSKHILERKTPAE